MSIEIFGTLGPADCSIPVLTQMFKNGMTGIRLNLSHTNLSNCEEWLCNLQTAAAKASMEPELLIDLQGPELRIGQLKSPLTLENGDLLCLTGSYSGTNSADCCAVVPCPPILFSHLAEGQRILLNDGAIEAIVLEQHTASASCICRILRGGILSSRKSIAIPGADIYPPTLTGEDLENLNHADQYHVTGVMLPFVRSREDLLTLRQELNKRALHRIRIFAKIENLEGVRMLPDLLPYCDHVVIARGDLGNAVTLQKLIGIQKDIAALCHREHKPFMVVTQMLASMEHNPVPTRAEVSDIFNAILDGAASLMVTGETAVGKYPDEVIRYLAETAREAMIFRANHT